MSPPASDPATPRGGRKERLSDVAARWRSPHRLVHILYGVYRIWGCVLRCGKLIVYEALSTTASHHFLVLLSTVSVKIWLFWIISAVLGILKLLKKFDNNFRLLSSILQIFLLLLKKFYNNVTYNYYNFGEDPNYFGYFLSILCKCFFYYWRNSTIFSHQNIVFVSFQFHLANALT